MCLLGSGQDCSRDNMDPRRESKSWMSTGDRKHTLYTSVTSLCYSDGLFLVLTQRPGQALKHLGGNQRLRQLSEVQFEDPGDGVYFSTPQPGNGLS